MQRCVSKMSRGWRRYLYLLMDDLDQGTYPLRRIDASTLFFPPHQKKIPSSTIETVEARLPQPCISFTPTPAGYGTGGLDFFTLFGVGGNKSLIAGSDVNGFTVMYDLDKRTLHCPLSLNEPKQHGPISLAVGDALYVMDRSPLPDSRCGFEALVYDPEQAKVTPDTQEWQWHRLPPPPYVLAPGHIPTPITGYTVVGGSSIWVSTPGIGTYSFDTSTGTWSKAGKWVLPFRGRADYFPEYNLWLGFSSKSSLLCSWDLSTAVKPSLHSSLEEDMLKSKSEGCTLKYSHLVHMGSGKFCVAKFFERVYYEPPPKGYRDYIWPQIERFAVFIGYEMDLIGPGGELRMRKHKSRRYMTNTTHGWVF
uniref:Uncharacterized protein n=1 Tax=Arundo donax TaxID=35708 RepID=A0A0A9CCG1_ARUDO